ncbi:unnamed protein product [Spirodela intermedia]|uniref:Uncharacterized protein n=1 Tax=Spirodela intermedia TaxID=51605 RepID=A0A7I8LGA9_SPIIN|nr:unnamed protein product [Spirodela intermedia]
MRNDVQKVQGGVPRNGKGAGFFTRRAISNYLKIVSSGASNVASTVRSAGASVASSIVEREDDAGCDQVHWAGFDKLEFGDGLPRRVLLLGYRSGFQVWDVEESDDVRQLVSRHDGPVSFLQMMRRPLSSNSSEDRFADARPLLAIAGDGFFSGGSNSFDGATGNGHMGNCPEVANENFIPTTIHFYSIKTHAYVHVLKFRSAIYTIRSGPRVVAVSQANQIHCFDAATLEREYTILTYPMVSESFGSGGIGYGPLAVGPRWLAYSGSPVVVSNSGRVSPEHLTPTTVLSTSPNGSLVAHYAMESSKQLAAGFMTLGDIGYKKLSKYCSDFLPDGSGLRQGSSSLRKNGIVNVHLPDAENAGMVIVRDLVSKTVVVQFRAHKSPISALSFDPTGILLVTASVHGHNINVFRVMPSASGSRSRSDACGSYTHLYRLQRGFTNAVIQDISFSDDSQWIMISSSRGTSHLFSISSGSTTNPYSNDAAVINSNNGLDGSGRGAGRWPTSSPLSKPNQHVLLSPGPPVTMSAVSRIRNGSNGWKGAVSGAAAAATGRVSPLSGAVASAFHNCNGTGSHQDVSLFGTKYHLLVFSPSGCVIQYVLRPLTGADSVTDISGLNTIFNESPHGSDPSLVVEAIQKWDICHKKKRRDQAENIDIYGEQRGGENGRHFHKGTRRSTSIYPADNDAAAKLKLTADEKRHLYISEVELHSHDSEIPLWAKSEIYFQAMVDDGVEVDPGSLSGGETEIERIPTRTVEARSKDLIPVFDYLQLPKLQQQPRSNAWESCENSCSPLQCRSEGVAGLDQLITLDLAGLHPLEEEGADRVERLVNNNNSSELEALLEFVNNGDGLNTGPQLEPVNNRESPKMMTYFADDDNEID